MTADPRDFQGEFLAHLDRWLADSPVSTERKLALIEDLRSALFGRYAKITLIQARDKIA